MVNLRIKLLLGFTLVFSIVFAGAYYWFYDFATERAIQRIQGDMENAVRGAAAGLDGELLLELYQEGEANPDGTSDHPAYQAQLAWFELVRSIEPRAWPYTYIRGEEANEIIWLADLWMNYDPERAVEFGDRYVSTGILLSGFDELTSYVPVNVRDLVESDSASPLRRMLHALGLLQRVGYSDQWGQWVSVYHPIFDPEGNPVGAIGLDFEADYVDQVQNAILESTVRTFAITYLALFILVYLLSAVLTRPIRRLTAIAKRVGEGDYAQDFSLLEQRYLRDEIGTLAEVFGSMVEKIRTREQTLKREVHKLRIEIDETKRHKQVSAIVDSEGFQDLKRKAREMRARKAEQDEKKVET